MHGEGDSSGVGTEEGGMKDEINIFKCLDLSETTRKPML